MAAISVCRDDKTINDLCGLVYDEKEGWPDDGIAPGTKWEDVPEDWLCPDCGVGKEDFELLEETVEEDAPHHEEPVVDKEHAPVVILGTVVVREARELGEELAQPLERVLHLGLELGHALVLGELGMRLEQRLQGLALVGLARFRAGCALVDDDELHALGRPRELEAGSLDLAHREQARAEGVRAAPAVLLELLA